MAEPAWKKFLKLKKEVPISTPNIADSDTTRLGQKRKREPLPEQRESHTGALKSARKVAVGSVGHGRRAGRSGNDDDGDLAEKKSKANKQKKKAKTKVRRSKKEDADAAAALGSALTYLADFKAFKAMSNGAPPSAGTWKFSKARQNYVIKHTYDIDVLSGDGVVEDVVLYLDSLRGGARERCVATAEGLIRRYERQDRVGEGAGDQDDGADKVNGEQMADDDVDDGESAMVDVSLEQYERAKKVRDRLTAKEGSSNDDDDDENAEEDGRK